MFSPRNYRLPLAAVLALCAAVPVQALDLTVPFFRAGLPYFGAEGVAGFNAIIGQIEVRGDEGNGIDGFDGHRQSGLGPNPGDLNYGQFGFQDVKDFSGDNDPSDNNFHGTFVAGVMASEYTSVSNGVQTAPFLGVAPLARYYGAIFDGGGTKAGFLSLNSSMNYVIVTSGANVVNHSWGGEPDNADVLDGKSFGESLLMDEYTGYAGKAAGTTGGYLDRLMVMAAGNSGATTGLLGTPADSFNGLTVGALDSLVPTASGLFDANRAPALRVAPFSSWRPLAGGRSGVDVVAPGSNVWSTLAINYVNQNDLVAGVASGTSLAAPHVAALAGLLYGAVPAPIGYVTDKNTFVFSPDHKLIKAIIINSADKIAGLDANGVQQATWQPGVVVDQGGVPNALVPLNYAVGSGSANAAEAYDELREAANRFWDIQTMSATGTERFYTFGDGKFITADPLQPYLLSITATLVWDRHLDFTVDTDVTHDSAGSVSKDVMSNLDLILQRESGPGIWEDVYLSAGVLDNVEHIYFPGIIGTDKYRLEVRATKIAEEDLGESYALAVSYKTVPEPGSAGLLLVGILFLSARRKN